MSRDTSPVPRAEQTSSSEFDFFEQVWSGCSGVQDHGGGGSAQVVRTRRVVRRRRVIRRDTRVFCCRRNRSEWNRLLDYKRAGRRLDQQDLLRKRKIRPATPAST